MGKGFVRKSLRRLWFGLLFLVLVPAILYGLLHTTPGREFLATQISTIVSSRVQGEWKVEDLSGWFPFQIRAGRVSAADSPAVPWLTLEGCEVDVDVRSLLDRRILLDRVEVNRVIVRPPPAGKKTSKKFSWDSIPSGHLAVVRIHELRLELSEKHPIPPMAVEGDLDHRDKQGGSRFAVAVKSAAFEADATFARSNSTSPWTTRVAMQADPGNPLNSILKIPADWSYTLDASSEGAAGRFQVKCPELGELTSTFELDQGESGLEIALAPEATLNRERVPAALARYTGYQASGQVTLRKPVKGAGSVEGIRLLVGQHRADLKLSLNPWSVGIEAALGELVFGKTTVRETSVRGRVDGGKPLAIALHASPRGIEGLPPDLLAWLGLEPSLDAVIHVDQSHVNVRRLTLSGAMGEVDAEAIVHPRDRSLVATWHGELRDLAPLPSLQTRTWAVPTQPVELAGEVSVTQQWTAVAGTVHAGAITLADGRAQQIDVEYAMRTNQTNAPVQLTAHVTGIAAKQLSVDEVVLSYFEGRGAMQETSVRVGPAVVRVGGELDAVGLNAQAVLAELPLVEIPGWEEVSGLAAGSLKIGGTWESPVVEASVRLSDVRSSYGGADGLKPIEGEGACTVSNGVLHAEARLETTGKSRLNLQTDLPVEFRLAPWAAGFHPDAEGSVSINGLLDLEAVNTIPVMAEQHLTGILELDLSAEGSPRSPRFIGKGRIQDGSYEHFIMGTDLRNLSLLMEADDQRLTIHSLSAMDPTGGTLSGTGHVILRPQDGFPFDFDLTLRQTQLLANDLLTAVADGTVQIAGTPAGMKVSGALKLEPVHIQIPAYLPLADPGYTIIDPLRPAPVKNPPRATKATGGIELEVKVDVPARMTVRGRGLDSQWGGKVTVRGTAAKPRIVGQLRSQRGRFNFFGQPFTLVESTIQFTGESPPRPGLDITFERTRSERIAYLKVGGNTGDPLLSLSSDPPLPSDELLPLVLFGKDIRDISPLQAVRAAQAARALKGEGSAFDFMGHAQRLLAVDQLNIEQADESEGVAKVTAGKYLSDRVYIEGQNQAGPDSGRISMEVELTPRISLETNIEAEMKQGVGLKFKRHF